MIDLFPNHGFAEHVILHIFYNGLNDESKSVLDNSSGGRYKSSTIEEGERLIQTIVNTREQWSKEEPTEFTDRNFYHIEDMEEFRNVIKENGKPIEQLKTESVDFLLFTNRKVNFRSTG